MIRQLPQVTTDRGRGKLWYVLVSVCVDVRTYMRMCE